MQLDIPVLACHQHFLADIGKDLLEPDHSALRNLFRRTKVRPEINNLVREIGRKIGFQINDARQAVLDWQSMDDYRIPPGRDGLAVVRNIAQWIFDYKADLSGLGFPFDRPYLNFYNRCMVALRAIDAFLGIPRTYPKNPKPEIKGAYPPVFRGVKWASDYFWDRFSE